MRTRRYDRPMAAAWFALIGSFGGAAIAFLGNAMLEATRRGAVRRDAAAEREAANLRDLQTPSATSPGCGVQFWPRC